MKHHGVPASWHPGGVASKTDGLLPPCLRLLLHDELHPALGAITGLGLDHLGVHRAGVLDCFVGLLLGGVGGLAGLGVLVRRRAPAQDEEFKAEGRGQRESRHLLG